MTIHPALAKILAKTGLPQLVEILSQQLNQSELTTLLLEVYRQKISRLKPADLLSRLPQNRFVQPSGLDPIQLREGELAALRLGREAGFALVELGPLAPLGASAVYGKINQNTVLSALRNCEVIADPSNLLCLLMCQEIKRQAGESLHWLCSHRTLRTALVEGPGRYAHFQMLAACSLLYTQDEATILSALWQHLSWQKAVLAHFGLGQLQLKIWLKAKRQALGLAVLKALASQTQWPYQVVEDPGSDYYQGFQLKSFAQSGEGWIELADCGLVPWAAELRGDRHFHCLISGIGLERLLMLN